MRGRKIKNRDEEYLHSETGLQFLRDRRKRHLLYMMYNLKINNPELLDTRDKGKVLRSNLNIRFKEYKLNNEICTLSPYVRGCNLWKQLSSTMQNAETLLQFKVMLTHKVVISLHY